MKNYYWKDYYKRGYHKLEEFVPLDKENEKVYAYDRDWREAIGNCWSPKPVDKEHEDY